MELVTVDSTTTGGAGKSKVFPAAGVSTTTDGDGAADAKAWAGEMTELVTNGSTNDDDDGAPALKASAGEMTVLTTAESWAGDNDVAMVTELKLSEAGEAKAASVAAGSTPDDIGAAAFHAPLSMGGSVPVGAKESNVSLTEGMPPSDSVVVVAVGTTPCSGEDNGADAAVDVGLSQDVSCVT